MLTYKQAKKIALEHLNLNPENLKILLYEPGIEFKYGWIFHYDHEGVFHPKLHEIKAKVNFLLKKGKLENEIEEILDQKELKILSNSIGLVGNLPLFIDRENSKISFHSPPTKAIQQEIFEIKSDQNFIWKIYITENIKGNLKKLKTLQSITDIEKKTILKTIKENKPISKSNSIRASLSFQKLLDENEISYKVSQTKLENNAS